MKARPTSQAKLIALVGTFWATVIGGSIAVHEYVVDPTPPPTPIQSLQSELTAAIAARTGSIAQEQRNAVLLEKLCAETATTLTTTFQTAGIAATFTAPYEAPEKGYNLGKCVLSVNDMYIAVLDTPDEFDSEYKRTYVNEEILKKLSPAALQRLKSTLPGAISGLMPKP